MIFHFMIREGNTTAIFKHKRTEYCQTCLHLYYTCLVDGSDRGAWCSRETASPLYTK